MSQMPEIVTVKDFVRFCKFHLAVKTHRLMKDPIWDTYTSEDIITEFFAHKFHTDKDFKAEFEFEAGMSKSFVDDFAAWADQQIRQAAKDIKQKLNETEDKVSFNPATMGE